MDEKIRAKAQAAHNTAVSKLARAMNDDYLDLILGRTPTYIESLHSMALALLGSPFCRVTHRKWTDAARDWLLSLN